MESKSKAKVIPLSISVELEELGKEQEWPKISVYVFNRSGQLLVQKPLVGDRTKPGFGKADLQIDELVKEPVMKIGPDVSDLYVLERSRKYVKKLSAGQQKGLPLAFKIPKAVWICWLRKPYIVAGNVETAGGGAICAGEVDVYDVDLYRCFIRLPDAVIERLRDALIDIVLRPPPVIEPTRWPRWDDDYCGTPPHVPPRPLTDQEILGKLRLLPKEWAFATERFSSVPQARSQLNVFLEKLSPVEKQAFLDRDAVEGVKVSRLLYTNTAQLRDMLANNFQPFRFYLCWYPWIYWLWWPFCWVCLEKLGTLKLQADGSFSETLWLSVCRVDVPDLWFVVRQNINGVDRVIYARYPVPCHTFYNHPSNKAVTLIVTDPDAIVCAKPVPVTTPGVYVMPLGIGDDEWYQIPQVHGPVETAQADLGRFNYTDPYATTLGLTMQFHESLLANGVKYYRWSYRQAGTTSWTALDTPIAHRYIREVSPGTGMYTVESFSLGPQTLADPAAAKGLFAVKDPHLAWISNDRYYAVWDTTKVPDGKYDLLLEMFDASGYRLTPTGNPALDKFKFILMPAATGPTVDKTAEEGGLILHAEINNKPVVAEILSVSLDGSAPPGECQFIEYQNKVTKELIVTYRAYHPDGFMRAYSLYTRRGLSASLIAPDPAWPLPAEASTPQQARFKVTELLPGTCNKSAFVALLDAYPRARNGIDYIRAYEAHRTGAFAMIPAPGPVIAAKDE